MNPRAEGAFEAISYVRQFTRRHKDKDRFASMLEDELDDLIEDITSGVAVDFRLRLRHPV